MLPLSWLNGNLIKNLIINDKENGADWSIYDGFGKESVMFGDRDIVTIDVPAYLEGAEAVKTACDSKMFTDDLGTFTAGGDITVYIAIDTRVVPILPDWLKSWQKSDGIIKASSDLTFELYKKNFKSGETVTLGKNGGYGDNTNYIVLAKNEEKIINGKLIKNLQVYDGENAGDCSVVQHLSQLIWVYLRQVQILQCTLLWIHELQILFQAGLRVGKMQELQYRLQMT